MTQKIENTKDRVYFSKPTAIMEVLIKYRNERKKEGASMAELNGLDGRINACMSNVGQEKTAFDIELLSYRAQIASASPVNKELLARLDTHIFHQLGSTPAKIIVVKIRTISMAAGEGVPVAVDINNETVGDLGLKAAATTGLTGHYKMIFNGKHHDDLSRPLSSTGLTTDSTVVICKRLGCDGNCCERGYAMLADAMYRDAHKLFKDVKPEVIHELFVVFSNLQEEVRAKRPKLDRAVECRVLPEAFRPKREEADWASLLSAARTRKPFRPWGTEALLCEAVKADTNTEFRTWGEMRAAEALICEPRAIVCEAVGSSKADTAVAALCKLLSEPTGCLAAAAAAAGGGAAVGTVPSVPTLNATPTNNITVPPTSTVIDDEDLYS